MVPHAPRIAICLIATATVVTGSGNSPIHLPAGHYVLISGPKTKLFATLQMMRTTVANGKVKSTEYPMDFHLVTSINIDGMGGVTQTRIIKETKIALGQNPIKGTYRELGPSRVHMTIGCESRNFMFHATGTQLTLVPEKGITEVYVRQD